MKFNYIKYGAYLALILVILYVCIYIFEKGKELSKAAAIN